MVTSPQPTMGRRLGVVATMVVAILLFTLPLMSALAAAKGKKTQGKVTEITATSITIDSKKSGPMTFTFAPDAKITLEGKDSKVTDVKVGMRVRIVSEDGKTATAVETAAARKHAAKAAPAAPVAPAPPAAAPTPAPTPAPPAAP